MGQLVHEPEQIITLARSRAPADRERLLLSIVEFCNRSDDQCRAPVVQDLLQNIFIELTLQAERDIRQRLAEKLATAAWAPPALVNILALDDIEIARPLIAQSPVLQDADLIRLLVEATLEHQIEVARRPGIGAAVVSAIIDQGQPAVLTALTTNETAEVGPLAMARLVAASRRIAAMRAPLASHPRLTEELAVNLYGWVGETLRDSIAKRFTIDPEKLAAAVAEAASEAAMQAEDRSTADTAETAREREEMERRLIAKLEAAGQLRPGYLLRALREGKMSLFALATATLGGFTAQEIQRSVEGNRPYLLALACAAVGIDRSVFPTILSLVQGLNGGRPVASGETMGRVRTAFSLSPHAAAEAFRVEIAGV